MKQYEGIVFDFNGVLLWDSHLHVQAWIELSEQLRGSPFSSDELDQHMHGKPNKYIFEYLLQRKLSAEELPALCTLKESRYRYLCVQNSLEFHLSPGAVELLDFLKEKDIPHTIATFSPKDNLDFFIEHLRLATWFDVEKVVYDDGSYTDKASMYRRAAAHLGLHPHQCIAVEDSAFGITAAIRAGMGKVIGIGPEELHGDLFHLGVHAAISALTQLEKNHFVQEV